MLKGKTETRSINMYGSIGDKMVCQFYANLNTENLESMDVGRMILDKEVYKENRVQLIKDQTDFENEVYKLQDLLIVENSEQAVAK